MSNVKFFFLYVSLIISSSAKADIGSFDVYTISVGNNIYHLLYESQGPLDEMNLNYLDYSKKEITYSVTEVVDQYLENSKVRIYKRLDIIHLDNIEKELDFVNKLFILNEMELISSDSIKGKYKILSAKNGNTYGFTYTEELNELDNHWIDNYSIQRLFSTSDFSSCDMTFYGIEGNLTKEEIQKLKSKVETLLKSQSSEQFKLLLSELYKDNIIMIGQCSC